VFFGLGPDVVVLLQPAFPPLPQAGIIIEVVAMTVWTKVSLDQANAWLALRGLPRAQSISPVEEGVEDSVFRLDGQNGTRCCLRLFERTEAQGPLTLVLCLAACGLPTCPPVADESGNVLVELNGKPAALFPWIEGAWVEKPSLAQINSIGTFMGQMARDGQSHGEDWRREDPRGWAWFEATTVALQGVLDQARMDEVTDEMAAHRSYWESQDLPRGPVHADLFRNNVLFAPDGSLGAVLDWGFCASGRPLVYDLAITANDWCLAEDRCALDQTKLDALLRARDAVWPLTDQEKMVWPMALRLAALRFYLSRLHDRYLPREPDGKSLDPAPFQAILRNRRGRMG